MKDYSWFIRGTQSAIFYYVSCGPCHDASYQRKRKKEALRNREEKERLRAEMPEAIHQPSPFDINPYWQEEITIGPGPPLRKAKRDGKARDDGGNSQRSRALTVGTESSYNSSVVEQQGRKIDLSKLDPAHIKERWHNRQRRDEENTSDDEYSDEAGPSSRPRRLTRQGSSVGPGGWPTGPAEKRKYRYMPTRAPPVSDLHPPIVVTPSPYRAERLWMKEGPPSAAFMSGKESTRTSTPSRSESALSNRERAHSSPRMAPNLHRQVGQKAVDDKLRRGQTPEMLPVSRGSSRRATIERSPQLSQEQVNVADYAETSTPESSFEMQRVAGRKKGRPRPLKLASSNMDSSESSEDETIITPTTTLSSSNGNITKPEPTYNRSTSAANRVRTSHARLSTIMSSNASNTTSIERARSMSPQRHGVDLQNENISPALSARSSPSPPASLAAAPVPFKATNYSLEAIPPIINGVAVPAKDLIPLESQRGKRQDSKVVSTRPPLMIKDSSLNVLQELVSPSTILNVRIAHSPTSEARIKLPDDSVRNSHDEDVAPITNAHAVLEDEYDASPYEEDGWLWTETGERKFPSAREARNVRNRWSMDF